MHLILIVTFILLRYDVIAIRIESKDSGYNSYIGNSDSKSISNYYSADDEDSDDENDRSSIADSKYDIKKKNRANWDDNLDEYQNGRIVLNNRGEDIIPSKFNDYGIDSTILSDKIRNSNAYQNYIDDNQGKGYKRSYNLKNNKPCIHCGKNHGHNCCSGNSANNSINLAIMPAGYEKNNSHKELTEAPKKKNEDKSESLAEIHELEESIDDDINEFMPENDKSNEDQFETTEKIYNDIPESDIPFGENEINEELQDLEFDDNLDKEKEVDELNEILEDFQIDEKEEEPNKLDEIVESAEELEAKEIPDIEKGLVPVDERKNKKAFCEEVKEVDKKAKKMKNEIIEEVHNLELEENEKNLEDLTAEMEERIDDLHHEIEK